MQHPPTQRRALTRILIHPNSPPSPATEMVIVGSRTAIVNWAGPKGTPGTQ